MSYKITLSGQVFFFIYVNTPHNHRLTQTMFDVIKFTFIIYTNYILHSFFCLQNKIKSLFTMFSNFINCIRTENHFFFHSFFTLGCVSDCLYHSSSFVLLPFALHFDVYKKTVQLSS